MAELEWDCNHWRNHQSSIINQFTISISEMNLLNWNGIDDWLNDDWFLIIITVFTVSTETSIKLGDVVAGKKKPAIPFSNFINPISEWKQIEVEYRKFNWNWFKLLKFGLLNAECLNCPVSLT